MVRIKRQLVLLTRVVWDFIQGMYTFRLVAPCVTVFGSARLTNKSPAYALAYKAGMALGVNGFTVMTGGGPGLMEAASRGARESGGKCVACRIRLSFEQGRNSYIDVSVSFRYFFVRKVMLIRHSCALVVLPGGLGTLDEVFEVMTLIQTQKISPLPIVFIGRDYWRPLLDLVKWMVAAGTITAGEMDRLSPLMLVTDDVGEMIAHLKAHMNHERAEPPVKRATAASEQLSAAAKASPLEIVRTPRGDFQ
jgi:uncharacterized protein (TIGR00730 family)